MPDGRSVELPGVQMWYVDSQTEGIPVIFLHAASGTSASWEPQFPVFVDAGYRPIAFDRRGAGRSIPRDDGSGQPGTAADDLEALVTFLNLPAFHLVAVAAGGALAFDYAVWKPERVRSIVAGAAVAANQEAEIRDFAERSRIKAIQGPSLIWARELSAGYRGTEVAGMRRWEEIEASARAQGFGSQQTRTPNNYERLRAIEAPVLVLAGAADLQAPPALMRLWAAQIKQSKFAVIGESGHSIAWEDPATFNAHVLEFLRRNE